MVGMGDHVSKHLSGGFDGFVSTQIILGGLLEFLFVLLKIDFEAKSPPRVTSARTIKQKIAQVHLPFFLNRDYDKLDSQENIITF
jgi:hypothetical protein